MSKLINLKLNGTLLAFVGLDNLLKATYKMANHSTFRGNKSDLPSKPCVQCGLPMTWRKSWAKNWDEVKYCSEKCRKLSKAKA